MVRERDVALREYLDQLIEEGRSAIENDLTASLENWIKTLSVPEGTAESSSANIRRIITARFEQCMLSLEPAKLMNLYAQRETYPFRLVVWSATNHIVRTLTAHYGDTYAVQVLQISDGDQRRQIEEALVGQVFDWICPIWPFC